MWRLLGAWGFSLVLGGILIDLARRRGYVARNFQGTPVPMIGGLVLMFTVGLGTVVLGGDHHGAAVLLLVGTLGIMDDLLGDGEYRGIGGHLRALGSGVITSGLLKALLGLLVALGVAARHTSSWGALFMDTLLFALSVNLVNLLDLRPGRAVKFSFLVLLPLLARQWDLSLLLLGALLGYVLYDLRGWAMLGDGGANFLGGALGYLLLGCSRGVKLGWLIGLLGIHLLTERYSLSQIIRKNSLLRFLDNLGRCPRLRE